MDGVNDGFEDGERVNLVGPIVVFDVGEAVKLGDVDPSVGVDGLTLGTSPSSCWMVEGTDDLLLTKGICEGCTEGMVEGEDEARSVDVGVVDRLKELDGLEELGPDNRRDDGPCDEFSGASLGVVGMTVTSFSPIVGPTTPFPLDEAGRIVGI